MGYATIEDVQARSSATLTAEQKILCATLLDDAAILIDSYTNDATDDVKKVVSCRMVLRAIGDGADTGVPIGASQGSMSALGYSQSWTMPSNGGAGELYIGKTEKRMLGIGDKIGSHSPVQDITSDDVFPWG